MSKDYMADGSLTEKWKYRFSFYDEHGFPGFWGASPEYKQALKGLNTRQKIIIRTNVIAFFFSWVFICIGFMEEGYCCSIPGDIFFNFWLHDWL